MVLNRLCRTVCCHPAVPSLGLVAGCAIGDGWPTSCEKWPLSGATGSAAEFWPHDQAHPERCHQRLALRGPVRAHRLVAVGADPRLSRLRRGRLRADDRQSAGRALPAGAAVAQVPQLRQERQGVESRRCQDGVVGQYRRARGHRLGGLRRHLLHRRSRSDVRLPGQ